MKTEQGYYLNIEHLKNGIKLVLNPERKEYLKESLIGTNRSIIDHFFELFEDHLSSGWESILPEEIGALTSCPYIFSNDTWRDDNNKLVQCDTVYWYPNYQISDPVEDLLKKGYIEFIKVEGD